MSHNKVVPQEVLSDEEITLVRKKPAEVVALRQEIYMVVTDRLNAGIQEISVGSNHQFPLEDRGANEYFTSDYSQAVVRFTELLTEDRLKAEAEAEAESEEGKDPSNSDLSFDDELVFVEDLDDLGLSPAERSFFV